MLKTLLGLDDSQDVTAIDLHFRAGWVLAIVLLALAVAFAIYLYRSESRLSRTRRVVLGGCQVLALLMLILVILEPVADVRLVKPYQRTMLVLLDTSRSMAIEDQRTTAKEVGEAARALGKLPLDSPLDAKASDSDVDALRQKVGPVSRLALARGALEHQGIDLFGKLDENYNVRFFSFDEALKPEGGADKPLEWLRSLKADGETSRVGTALSEAVARYAGQPVAGVVLLSDFAWVKGQDPVIVASHLKASGVPVYAVPIGLPAPPDIHVRSVIGPEVVFQGDRVPLRAQIDSHGFEGQTVELTLTIDGQRATSLQVELRGGVQFEELTFTPQRNKGTMSLEVEITALAGETSDKNNSRQHKVRILDEKIKVLYVEGMPRWEYRYLRWVLLRDPRLEVSFLMTQGDPALAATSNHHISRFPQEADDALKYDLIILGDVPSSYFSSKQLDLMTDLVKRGGGSLLMIAGPMASPASYRETPIADVLPINIGSGEWESVSSGVHPVVTAAGRESQATSLSTSAQTNERIWSHVRPMYSLPRLAGAKPGATVLLSLPKEAEEIRDYPLVAWQRYGNGKSLFVATEDLWRMRLEVGDRYHARFWGQTIQFLTLSRLLGQNKQISLETDRHTYSAGEQVRVFANVLTESFEPVLQTEYAVVLENKADVDASAEMELLPVPKQPGLYSGVHLASTDGSYVLRTKAQDAEISNRVEFEIATIPVEDRETAASESIARQIAELSGGEVVRLPDLGKLPEKLAEEKELSSVVRMERDLWDAPILFILLVAFAGIEWFLRRRDNLV
jgi:uncharacterized membrane protein